MTLPAPHGFSVFVGHRLIARGDLLTVAKAARAAINDQPLVLSDETGRPFDLDLRGTALEVSVRYAAGEASERRRGRPKLGVTAREVTLLPRHWDWLASQPGGASAALRRLVEEARRAYVDTDETRRVQERVYRAMTSLAGDLAGYEEATRAVFRSDREAFNQQTADWPPDLRAYLFDLWPAS
jgi:hypothetical protein